MKRHIKLPARKSLVPLYTINDFKEYFMRNGINRYYVESFSRDEGFNPKLKVTFLCVHWYSFLLKGRIKRVIAEIPNLVMRGIVCEFVLSSESEVLEW